MQNLNPSSKMNSAEVIQKYFAENRSRVLELAAFLDRLDRATDSSFADGTQTNPLRCRPTDHRIESLRQSISELLNAGPGRLLRIQHLLSDHSEMPLASAPSEKSASGVPRPSSTASCC